MSKPSHYEKGLLARERIEIYTKLMFMATNQPWTFDIVQWHEISQGNNNLQKSKPWNSKNFGHIIQLYAVFELGKF